MATFAGEKFSKKHTTAIDIAEDIIQKANNLPEVSKITLSYIKGQAKSGSARQLKFIPVKTGLKMKVAGPTGGQEIYIVCKKEHREKVREQLESVWEGRIASC